MKSYLNDIRLKKAAEFLMNRDLTIGDIAFAIGFGCVEHFKRVFKSRYGIPPRKYRMQSGKGHQPDKQLWSHE
jgi:AraC-like DNA-binding protein